MRSVAYLDSSAVVKLVVKERHSKALRRFLGELDVHASSTLARTEVVRAVRRADSAAVPRAFQALERLVLIRLPETLLDEAGLLEPAELPPAAAIHIVSARMLLPQLAAFVTYDERLAAAALSLGLPVEAPGGR